MAKNAKKNWPKIGVFGECLEFLENVWSFWRMFGVFGVVWGVREIWSGLEYFGEA